MARRTACVLVLMLLTAPLASAEHIIETARQIPVAGDVDVLVVGGPSGAVAAACQASQEGASVFLIAPRPYLGTDMASTLRLWLEEGERPTLKLAVDCFGGRPVTTPFAVKAAMDRALIESQVRYLTGCYVTDVLRDEDGRLAGVVMANRSGRQAIRAKVVIDATEFAIVARLAGASFRPFQPGAQTFRRVVAGGEPSGGDHLSVEQRDFTYDSVAKKSGYRLPVYEYTLQIDMPDGDVQSFFNAENRARDLTYQEGSETASEVLVYLPRDTIVGQRRLDAWPGAESADLACLRPKGISELYVLSAYADLGGEAAAKIMRPLELMATGERLGCAAAAQSASRPPLAKVALPETLITGGIVADVRESVAWLRRAECDTIQAGSQALPILGRYDVVIVGGGTSGAPAGIAAARSGARTLVVEYLHELGGVGTAGLIGKYWYGLRRGFTAYVDEQVNPGSSSWSAVAKAEWLRRELIRSGADVWFGTLGCGAIVRDGQFLGVVVATPQGRGAVLAETVVDATGNADVAAAAGAATGYGIGERGSLNVQIAGFPERPMKNSYVNTCYTMVDDTDVLDVWHLMAWKRSASAEPPAFDVGQLVDSRERRRILGDYTLSVVDILCGRTFPDTISQHYSNFDAAAFPDSRLLLLSDAKGPCFHADLPYRCLLPKGLDGILVIGLGASAQRDAMTLIRMQPDLQNQGYAAGMAAAAAARLGGRTRAVDVKALQRELIRQDLLDERVYTDIDSCPMSDEAVAEAVEAVGEKDGADALAALAVILAHPDRAIPLLRARHRQSPAGKKKLECARVLAVLGDGSGAADLAVAVDSYDRWDGGAALTSQRKTGNTFSDLDRLVIALGFSGAREAWEPLLRKLRMLEPGSEMSHYKAISLAIDGFKSPAAADALAALLAWPGFAGHATMEPVTNERIAPRLVTSAGDAEANRTNLNKAMKELIVAAMLYRCGDRDGKGEEVLEQYERDIHGHFAAYARWALAGRPFGAQPGK